MSRSRRTFLKAAGSALAATTLAGTASGLSPEDIPANYSDWDRISGATITRESFADGYEGWQGNVTRVEIVPRVPDQTATNPEYIGIKTYVTLRPQAIVSDQVDVGRNKSLKVVYDWNTLISSQIGNGPIERVVTSVPDTDPDTAFSGESTTVGLGASTAGSVSIAIGKSWSSGLYDSTLDVESESTGKKTKKIFDFKNNMRTSDLTVSVLAIAELDDRYQALVDESLFDVLANITVTPTYDINDPRNLFHNKPDDTQEITHQVRPSDIQNVPKIDGTIPKDLDGDGKYMDLSGNGEIDYADLSDFFQLIGNKGEDWEHTNLFDYSGNGELDYQDLITLFDNI